MLKTEGIVSGYGKVMILNQVSIEVNKGEVVSIIGRNGVGKSTLIKTLIGLNKAEKGTIHFDGNDITRTRTHVRAVRGMGYAPQGHGIFPRLTVEENLKMGGMINSAHRKPQFDTVYGYFPRLAERRRQMAGTMSGGEQAMLSIGRVLAGYPQVLLLDEPSEGVQPNIVQQIGEIIIKICKEMDMPVLLVEQHMGLIQQVTKRGYVLDKGSIIASLRAEDLSDPDRIRQYLTV